MRSGFNTNYRHRGILFHVQTEDSGQAKPHLITHLFFEGTILSSEKQSYAGLAEDDDVNEAVKKLMERQHLGMLKRLRAGSLDQEIEVRLGAEIFSEDARSPETESVDAQPGSASSRNAVGPAGKTGERQGPGAPADASLDELVLDYLAERGSRSPGAR